MQSFIKRNGPVFIIGTVLALVFLGIIFYSQQDNPREIPGLIRLNTEEEAEIDFGEAPEEEPQESSRPATNPQRIIELNTEELDKIHGMVEIRFTSAGRFEPSRTSAFQNQLARWVNNSDRVITLVQIGSTSTEWGDKEVTLNPEEFFEIRLTNLQTWAYQETQAQEYGIIKVTPIYRNTTL